MHSQDTVSWRVRQARWLCMQYTQSLCIFVSTNMGRGGGRSLRFCVQVWMSGCETCNDWMGKADMQWHVWGVIYLDPILEQSHAVSSLSRWKCLKFPRPLGPVCQQIKCPIVTLFRSSISEVKPPLLRYCTWSTTITALVCDAYLSNSILKVTSKTQGF